MSIKYSIASPLNGDANTRTVVRLIVSVADLKRNRVNLIPGREF
jgi:hypothetical protein